jgi:uncharacterized membrane protein
MSKQEYIDHLTKALKKAEANYKRTKDSDYKEEINHYRELLRQEGIYTHG